MPQHENRSGKKKQNVKNPPDVLKNREISSVALRIEPDVWLQTREEHYRAIFNQSGAGIAETDLTGRFISVNDRYCEIIGRSKEQTLQLTMQEITHPEDLPGNLILFEKILQGGPNFEIEKRYLRPDRQIVWVHNTVCLLRDGMGQPVSVIAVSQDITTQKRLEREQEEVYQRNVTLLSVLGQIVYEWHPANGTLIWDGDFTRILGYSREEMGTTTQAWEERIHPADRQYVQDKVNAAIEQKKIYNLEYRYLHKNGSYRWMQDSGGVLFDLKKDGTRILGIFSDIHERKMNEEALARSERMKQVILDSVGEGIQVLDIEGRMVFENPAALAMLGWTLEEMQGKQMHNLMHHHRADGSEYPYDECPVSQTLRDGITRRVEKEVFFRADGTSFPVEYTCSAIVDNSDSITGAVVSFKDNSERVILEHDLRERMKELTSLYRVQNDMRSDISLDELCEKTLLHIRAGMQYPDLCEVQIIVNEKTFRTSGYQDSQNPQLISLINTNDNRVGRIAVHYTENKEFILPEEANMLDSIARIIGEWLGQKAVQHSLVFSERRYRELAENFPNGVVSVYNRDLVMTFSAGLDLASSGYRQEDLVGRRFQDMVTKETWEIAKPHLLSAFEGSVSSYEAYGSNATFLRVNVAPLHNDSGEINEILIVAQNITDLKKAEFSLQNKIAALETLGNIQREVSLANRPETVLELLCRRIVDLIDVPKSIFTIRDQSATILMSAQHGLSDPESPAGAFAQHWEAVQLETPHSTSFSDVVHCRMLSPDFLEEEHIRSMAYSPLVIGDSMYGTLAVFDTKPRGWTADELQMLELLAGQAANILQKINLLNNEKIRRAELSGLYQFANNLGSSINLDEILKLAAKSALDLLHVTHIRIAMVEEQNLTVKEQYPVRNLDLDHVPMVLPLKVIPICMRVLSDKAPVVLHAGSSTSDGKEEIFLFMDVMKMVGMIPLMVDDQPLGLLILGEARDPDREPITTEKLKLAVNIAGQTSSAIHRAQLYHETRKRVSQLEALNRIDKAINTNANLRITLQILIDQTQEQLEADAVAVYLFKPQEEHLEYFAGTGFGTNEIEVHTLSPHEGIIGRILMDMQPLIGLNLKEANKLTREFLRQDEGFRLYCGIPLIAHDKILGVMEIFWRSQIDLTRESVSFMGNLSGQAAIAIDNAQLFESLQRSKLDLESRVADRTMELKQMNAKLERANRAKDEFLANMSHELRTPLSSILGYSEILLEQHHDHLAEYQRRYLSMIDASGKHLLGLINDILDLSKIESGWFEYKPEQVNMNDICQSSMMFVKSQAQKKSIQLLYKSELGMMETSEADPRRLKQILINLLTNAVKFTPENGQIHLSASGDPAQKRISISVKDTGIGIRAEDLRRIFQPFVQVEGSLNRQFEGTGLGLALAQRLTDLHGGSISVESEFGKGSCFTVILPWKGKFQFQEPDTTPYSQEIHSTSTNQSASHGKKVLLAEDTFSNIEILSDYLHGHGFLVEIAHDGYEALSVAEVFDPDIILMDIQMPRLDGLESMRHLRNNPRFAQTPIIAVTALAMVGDRERCLEAGANEYMSKPVSLKLLVKMIRKMLSASESGSD